MNIGNVVFRCLLCGLPLSAALNFARGKECPHPTPPPQYPTPSVTRERVRLLGGNVRSAGRACVSGCAPPHPNLPKA